ncbi:MAG: methionine--tRNA ligase [Candidatus Hadarchaeota archaeon]
MKKSFYISTAIDYPSTVPHLGHAYEKICADVIARFKRLQGFEVHFSTGTDEHGLKIQRCAEKAGKNPKEFVDSMSNKFKELWDELDISYDDFIRTTEARHVKVVKSVFGTLHQAGDIYKGFYEGQYCTECETFYSDDELTDGKCPVHNKKVELVTQECYFFRMSKYRDKVVHFIEQNPDSIQPESRRKEILNRLKEPLRDLCVSRTDFDWGIRLPIDKKHVLYVWVDALANYLTTIDYPAEKFDKFWPADVHLIGKDISWHHCVIWRSLLLSLGLSLPKKIFIHGFVTYKGEKLSKSRGVLIDPLHLIKTYPVDALRYFLVREISFGQDGSFSEDGIRTRLNDELADILGNFVHRVLTFTKTRYGGKISEGEIDEKLESESRERLERAERLLEDLKVTQALDEIISLAKRGNEYFQSQKPWDVIKKEPEKAASCILNCANLVQALCVALAPFLPETSENLARQLGVKVESWSQAKSFGIRPGHEIGTPSPIFKKAEEKSSGRSEALVSMEDFKKVDMRVGKVSAAERVSGSDKLLKLDVQIGEETRTLVAGVADQYSPQDLIGKQIVVVVNLEPAKIRGIKSDGMLLAAVDGDKVSILTLDRPLASGSKVM